MVEYIVIAAFIIGVIVGAGILAYGFKLGFRASYEIRECKEQEDMGKGLFGHKEPAEFELLEQENEKTVS